MLATSGYATEEASMRDYDVVVLGAGLAGLTAGMIAAQHGVSVVVVDQMGAAGQVLNVDRIDKCRAS